MMEQRAVDPTAAQRQTTTHTWPHFGGSELDAAQIERLTDFVNARLDLADHKLLLLLKSLLARGDEFDESTRTLAIKAVLDFRYSLFDPGTDSMTTWSESHQLVFATCEYLAGTLLPTHRFTNDARTGERKARRAAARLDTWLSDRFRYGFSEWNSVAYAHIKAAALTMLVDHAPDASLQTKAAMVLDLLLLDAALHSFDGVCAGSAGRIKSDVAKNPETAPFTHLMANTFGATQVSNCDFTSLNSLFCCREKYKVPHVITELFAEAQVRRVRTCQGLDLDEVSAELSRDLYHPRPEMDRQRDFYWLMQALVTPKTIADTLDIVNEYGLHDHRMFSPLTRFAKTPRRARRATLTMLNPIVVGSALQRANVQTFATRNYLLSSVQRYHPGSFGDQQHIWQARLPGGISVFGTHPGSSKLSTEIRKPTPGYWVGNGILPDVAQHDNVLLAICNLHGRKGYLEGKRHDFVHFFFPAATFDETRFGLRWVVGRSGNAYLAIIGTHPLELVSESEVIQRGQVTGYAVVLADDEEVTSMADFVRNVKEHMLTLRGDKLSLVNPFGRYELTWRGDFVVGGQRITTDYARYDSHWVNAPRTPTRIEVQTSHHKLELDWRLCRRHEEELDS